MSSFVLFCRLIRCCVYSFARFLSSLPEFCLAIILTLNYTTYIPLSSISIAEQYQFVSPK